MNTKHLKPEPMNTVLVITVGLVVVYYITKWQWTITTSIIIGVLGLLSNFIANMIHLVWMKITWTLNLIVPNILLSLIFYLFLTPIACLYRTFGPKNQLSLKNTEQSLFKEKNKDFDKKSFEKPW